MGFIDETLDMDNNKDFVLRLKSIIDTAIDGIITIGVEGIVESMNPAAANIFGYEENEVLGKNIKQLMPEPYHSSHDDYLKNYKETRKAHIIGVGREVIGLKKDGTLFPFRLAVSEVLLNDRVIYTGIIHDLTEVKKAKDEILKLNKELESKIIERTYELENAVNKLLLSNNKLESEIETRKETEQKYQQSQLELETALQKEKELGELKTRFVSMASHEFRTPLASILSSASLIGKYEYTEDQEKREKHVNRIKSSINNLTGILNDFLSLSKLEEGMIEVQYEVFSIVDLICSVKEDLLQGKRKNRIIKLNFNDITTIESDLRIMKNILFNVMSNALKYSDEEIHVELKIENNVLNIKITDTGLGIPEEEQKHLFTRFFRASNASNIQGTGLGLNIVKRYVELLNGSISFTSKESKGTTFTILLPR